MTIKPYSKDIIRKTLTMAWPAVLEAFFVALAGLVDSYMVSALGASAVAAIGLTTQPKFIGFSIFFATGTAVSALVARRRGEGDRDGANRMLSAAIAFAIVVGIAISVLLVVFADPIIHFCGSTEDTHADAVLYYRILMAGLLTNSTSILVNAAQRGCGNTKIAMTTNVTANAVNVVANWLLIEGHLGFPAMGIAGAGIATVFGTFVAAIMSLRSVMKKDNYVSIPYILRSRLWPKVKTYGAIFKIGYGLFLEQLLMRVGFMATALMAAAQGTYAMAAHQVSMNLMGLSFSFGDGLQVTAIALIGYSLGQRDKDLAKEYGRTCRMLGYICEVVLAIIYLAGSRTLFSLFFREPEIVEIGVRISRIVVLVLFFQISQVIIMSCLRAAGDTNYTAMASAISVTIVRTALSYFFGYTLGFGILGIWVGVLGDQVSRFIFASIRFAQGKWVDIKI